MFRGDPVKPMPFATGNQAHGAYVSHCYNCTEAVTFTAGAESGYAVQYIVESEWGQDRAYVTPA
jgi:hypothetical protein